LAQLGAGHDRANKAKVSRETIIEEGLNDVENEGPALTNSNPIKIDKERYAVAIKRKDGVVPIGAKKKQSEIEIEHKLKSLVNLNFNETPLKTVINDLRTWQGINIVVDDSALKEGYVSLDQ